MKTEIENKVKYLGIADCRGIEYFYPAKDIRAKGLLQLRAECNSQRHAVYYEADLSPDEVEQILHRLQDKDFTGALKTLKDCAENPVLLGADDAVKSWELIPNKDLDPWA